MIIKDNWFILVAAFSAKSLCVVVAFRQLETAYREFCCLF